MEFLVVVGILIAISVLDDRVRGKKKGPPPTVPQEIPRQKRGAQSHRESGGGASTCGETARRAGAAR